MYAGTVSTSETRVLAELDSYLRENLSPYRYAHTVRVCQTAMYYAGRFGVRIKDARLAAMAHDMAREWPDDRLLEFVFSNSGFIGKKEQEKPVLLHGAVAAILLRSRFGVANPDVLEAVENHTLGNSGLCKLSKVLFAADYLEPGRKFTTVSFRRSVKVMSLDCIVAAVIEHNAARYGDTDSRTDAMYAEVMEACAEDPCSDCFEAQNRIKKVVNER